MKKRPIGIRSNYSLSVALVLILIVILLTVSLQVTNTFNKIKTNSKAEEHSIIDGEVVEFGEWPFLAAIYFNNDSADLPRKIKGGPSYFDYDIYSEVAITNDDGSETKDSPYFCVGALIDQQWVVTAAHCVDKYKNNPEKIRVAIGINKLKDRLPKSYINSKVLFSDIVSLYIPENYILDIVQGIQKNDIALLKLRHQVLDFPTVNINTTINKYHGKAYVLGWACIDNENYFYPNDLRKYYVDVEGPIYPDVFHLSDNSFYQTLPLSSTNMESGAACIKDSGGPLLIWNNNKWNLIGILNKVRLVSSRFTNPSSYLSISDTKTNKWLNSFNIKADNGTFVGEPPSLDE